MAISNAERATTETHVRITVTDTRTGHALIVQKTSWDSWSIDGGDYCNEFATVGEAVDEAVSVLPGIEWTGNE